MTLEDDDATADCHNLTFTNITNIIKIAHLNRKMTASSNAHDSSDNDSDKEENMKKQCSVYNPPHLIRN